MTATPQHPVLAELKRILSIERPRDELLAWQDEGTKNREPFWVTASNYLLARPHDLAAIVDGFDKSGDSVIAFVDTLKGRVKGGPPEPEVHQVEEHNVCVYLWRTSTGPKLVAFQRAPAAPLVDRSGSKEGLPPDAYHYSPDLWRQLSVHDRKGDYLFSAFPGATAATAGTRVNVCSWPSPPRHEQDPLGSDRSTSYRKSTECKEPGCIAVNAEACGHQTVSEALGTRLPNPEECSTAATLGPTKPGAPNATEQGRLPEIEFGDGVATCNATECENRWAFLDDGTGRGPETCPKCGGRRMSLQWDTASPWTCGVCEGIDPESSDAPNDGHHWRCPLGKSAIENSSTGVSLDPTAPDDLQANPNWSPVGDTRTGSEREATSTPGPLPEDSAPSATGDARQGSGDGETITLRHECRKCGEIWAHTGDVRTGDCPKCGAKVDKNEVEVRPTGMVIHCLGAWVPPGDQPFACSPAKTDSALVYRWRISEGDKPLRDHLPGVTCATCRAVMEAVMKATRWKGPNLEPASLRGWFPAIDSTPLDQGKENMERVLADGVPVGQGPLTSSEERREASRHGLGAPTAPDECPECKESHYPEEDCATAASNRGNPPEVPCANCSHVGKHHDHKTKECAECGRCPGYWPVTTDADVKLADLKTQVEPLAGEVECNHVGLEGRVEDVEPWTCSCPPECNCHPCLGDLEERATELRRRTERSRAVREDLVLNETDKCACGCARATHSRPGDGCSRCPCVVFRAAAGATVEIESDKDRSDYVSEKRRTYALSLDMGKVTKQRTAKEYAQCQLCLAMIKGPIKNDAGKVTTPGDEWVGPTAKLDKNGKKKTPSMRHRSHLSCADAALESLKTEVA